ncbi:MAG TPA: Asp-tRNA(Asn)/Glu-tRNA(Gln) amidotransferase subunit GatC [Pyrinomonadaceae bacterium]|nr:Asp-tRNA(Asn)/Glu-tRNA(Gln) amidotransferase subunit GatC [Pyrinomonadaceae bacterium]HMP65109.1 Asp-tRNA(Asn)/Glu-tRNA(Gln) amidotransferase subunit GatC [Pyrinomonadaceae bacterium]
MDVKKVAKLAHLDISEEEVAIYTPQLAKIVEYVEQLGKVDITGVDPMLGGLTDEGQATDTMRDDEVIVSSGQEWATCEAPAAVEGHFQVPKVL